MNFYKHHLGDYDGATAHLSWDEDMAYTRLLRTYYRREQPFADTAEAFRLTRAVSKTQKAAITSILAEFFEQRDDGWHNKRADEEIEQYQAQATTNRRIAQQRTVKRSVNEPSQDRAPNQEPLTKNQEPEPSTSKRKSAQPPDGVKILTDLGVAEQHAKDWLAVRKAKRAPLTDTVIQSLQNEAAKAGITFARAVEICAKKSWQGFSADWDWNDAGTKKVNGTPAWWASDASIEAKGNELGLKPRPGENWQQFKGRINERLAAA